MSATASMPQADPAIIERALNLLFRPDDVIEIRALSLRGLVASAIAEHMPDERYAALMEEQAHEKRIMREWVEMNDERRDAS